MSVLREMMQNRLGDLLATADGPMNAVALAEAMGMTGDHEQVRRAIRRAVKALRDETKLMICSSIADGYWIARSPSEYAAWQAAERKRQVFRFARMRDNREAAQDKHSGQGKLFETGSNKGAFA